MTANNTNYNQKQPEVSTFCKVNVANNVAQAKVRDLTEQGKTGKLKDGFYYVKLVDEEYGRIITDKYFNSFRGWEYSENWQISEVLAPVPSYEEWQKVLNIDFNNEVLRLENAKLKELLKECREKLKYCVRETYELQTKIDEVLK